MINLPDKAVEVLEKVMNSEHEFEALFKALATGGGGLIAVPDSSMVPIHTNLLLHLIANLVEAQTEIGVLTGQIAILRVDLKGHRHVEKVFHSHIKKYGGDAVIMEDK